MVDDVITDGMTKKESLKLIQQLSPAKFSGIIVAVDRMESNGEGKDTVTEFQNETGIPIKFSAGLLVEGSVITPSTNSMLLNVFTGINIFFSNIV